ncbi:SDR family oxidoreductase [Streptomyces sp. NPDC005962]|uniref:SDR family oxidoreductase n=1 Tax=Streptomyces sp. NPDC005962 TaxID=3154466 RepID=UPI0033ED8D8C
MPVPSFRLDDSVALVTGAGSGIGRRLAIGLAETGADVGCLDLPGSDLAGTVTAIEESGRRAVALPADVTRAEDLAEAVSVAERDLGPLRLAVNAAGIANAAPAEDMPVEQWSRVVDVNLTGVFLSCQAEGRALLRNGGGAIVNIASMSGTIANRGLTQAHYNASKAAVMHLTKSLATEWCTRGVRVNSVSPGYTATPMNLRPEVAERVAQFEADTPLGRMATVDEMVGPTVFLLSDAASFVTGADLLVDGGVTCW